MYLEVVYRRPKYLATVIFSASAIILGFSASNCIVSPFPTHIFHFSCDLATGLRSEVRIKISASVKNFDKPNKHTRFRRTFRRSLGGTRYSYRRFPHFFSSRNIDSYTLVITFTTLLHGFAPRLGVYVMNVGISPHILTDVHSYAQILTLFKTIILIFIVVTGKAFFSFVNKDYSKHDGRFRLGCSFWQDTCQRSVPKLSPCFRRQFKQQ